MVGGAELEGGLGHILRKGGLDWGPLGVLCCSPHLVDAEGWMRLLLLEVTSCFSPQPSCASCGCWR